MKNKIYVSLISLMCLGGCATDRTPKPAQVAETKNTDPCKIDQNLMDYHISKKKNYHKVKVNESLSSNEESCFEPASNKFFGKDLNKFFNKDTVAALKNSKEFSYTKIRRDPK